MGTLATYFVSVRPEVDGFPAELRRKTQPGAAGAGKKAGETFGKSMVSAVGAVFAAGVVVDFFKTAIAEAQEAAKVGKLTEAVIRSTGGAAKVSAAQVGELAGRLSDLSGVDDEVIQSAGNVLLTFTKVRNEIGKGNDVFDQGTEAALNMSAALGTDLQSAAILVGKALNDPVSGTTALKKAGIQLTEQQKEQIKAFVESGNVMGAQKIILAELTTQFGGAAEAAASPADKARVAWGNFQEMIGTKLLPTLNSLLEFGIENQAWLIPLVTSLSELAVVIGAVIVAMKTWDAVESALSIGVDTMTAKVKRAGVAIAAYAVAVQLVNAAIGSDLKPQIDALSESIVRFSKTGRQSTEWMRLFGDDSEKLALALRNATSSGKGFATTLESLIPGASAADASWTKNIQRIEALDAALAGLASSGHSKEAAAEFKEIWQEAQRLEIPLDKLQAAFPEYVAAAAKAAAATNEVGGEAKEAAKAGDSLLDVWNELNGTMLSADEAMLEAEQSIVAITDAFKGSKGAIEGNTVAALENRIALEKSAQAAADAAQKYLENGGSAAGAAEIMDRFKQRAIDAAVAAGGNAVKVRALADELFRIPAEVKSNVTVTTTRITRNIEETYGRPDDRTRQADGSLMSFKAFAAGGLEQHVAQIVRAGTIRVWGEPETGGEAYIPLAPTKRTRSTSILSEVARQFGYRLVAANQAQTPTGPTAAGWGVGFDLSPVMDVLRRILDAVERVAPGVGAESTGSVSAMRILGRSM